MAEIVTFSPAVSIIGWGALSKIPSVLGSKGLQRIVIVTDGNENLGDARAVAASLAEDGIGIDR